MQKIHKTADGGAGEDAGALPAGTRKKLRKARDAKLAAGMDDFGDLD